MTLVFLDTETTGLALDDPIWEVAAIRREPDGTEQLVHFHVEMPPDWAGFSPDLPQSFRDDYAQRYGITAPLLSRGHAAEELEKLFRGRPHVVGAVPNFDTERIAHQFCVDGWHYHLIDVETLAVGFLSGFGFRPPMHPPWDSDELSMLLFYGQDPERFGPRHQALSDVLWVKAIYDRIIT